MRNTKIIFMVLAGLFLLIACAKATETPVPEEPQIEATPEPYFPTIFESTEAGPASEERLNDPRPNIIFIFTDDQPYHTVDFMPTVRDVLKEGGINFENAFATTPLCCPSRASILNGEYVHNHQVYTNNWPQGGAKKFIDISTYATWLQGARYHPMATCRPAGIFGTPFSAGISAQMTTLARLRFIRISAFRKMARWSSTRARLPSSAPT